MVTVDIAAMHLPFGRRININGLMHQVVYTSMKGNERVILVEKNGMSTT
jgi:hypothetical protein